jgi:hypothetical protein
VLSRGEVIRGGAVGSIERRRGMILPAGCVFLPLMVTVCGQMRVLHDVWGGGRRLKKPD